jgi:hypothetical protein
MEERIEEFNVLMEVVQGEAEEIFLDTASTVRGVREGARAISSLGARALEDDDDDDQEEDIDEDEDRASSEEANALATEDG